ncbi:hypothetical protein GCM10018781_62470 [Kitasatospora indigofera]|uniref:Protein kinase domain-containing protein n=1 Tax=Kitasatospora indigofera TaxID=67307 RepID=A0A919L1Y5_9ACTN|nr:hypothetical protein GCM10018781_62470 [Kitasatospora indigofera]
MRVPARAPAVAWSVVHRLGLVHRDLRAATITLTTAGPRLRRLGFAAAGTRSPAAAADRGPSRT